ncbi:mechanosensitive ion channel family protein [Bythopirellula goksoeyrii]|uniref:Small-conductance mechanosensitive channel n=1 Tax=Bythopirellula goksoeyrii TaxID=1400387 RepID=A0A5B9Q3L0_9BACT|nr:mechanosensitive ion channel family protein [Bythopirellula goksoeyrii]QEG33608.1 Small-conductance mechanosensitive channel [Bythopirellula goksoeyrii]
MSSLRSILMALWILSFPAYAAAQDSAKEKEEATPDYTAVTTIDPEIPLDQLEILVKPLTKGELVVESDAWFDLLRNKARHIAAVRLGVKKTNEALDTNDAQAAKTSVEVAKEITDTVETEAIESEQKITDAAQESLGLDVKTSEGSVDEGQDTEAGNGDSATDVKEELLEDITVLQSERTALSDRLEVVLNSLAAKGGDVDEYRTYATSVSGIDLDTSDAWSAWHGITGWLASKEGGQRHAWNIAKFLLILLITYLVAKFVAAIVYWLLERKVSLSQLAEQLIASSIKNLIMLVGFAIALTALEVDITPILAAIGAMGLVVGLALQGTLSNFASGLMILINRPFDIGNVVTAGGVTGTVDQMNLVSTKFRTFDNQTIYVPNNEIWNNVITNITANDTRRVDLEFGIGYDDDFEEAEKIIREVVDNHELVLDDPEPVVVTHALADSSVNIVCRPWANTSDYWQVKTDVTREVKRRFDQAGISIPYPQQDVHMYTVGAGV